MSEKEIEHPSVVSEEKERVNKTKSIGIVKIPSSNLTENDVLCGRGGKTNHHIGNVRFREIAEQMKETYINVKYAEKSMIACNIVDRIYEKKGRFLKKCVDNDDWVEVSKEEAIKKTCQVLREDTVKRKALREKIRIHKTMTKHNYHSSLGFPLSPTLLPPPLMPPEGNKQPPSRWMNPPSLDDMLQSYFRPNRQEQTKSEESETEVTNM